MAAHLDPNDPRYRDLAAAILRRHDNNEAEANIASSVRDFFILTGLANADEIIEENPPSDDSRRAVDLTALDTFVEFKRRIGTTSGFSPDPANVSQIDEYLELSKSAGKGVRTGILTDGKYWLLRWPGQGLSGPSNPMGLFWTAPTAGCHCSSGYGTARSCLSTASLAIALTSSDSSDRQVPPITTTSTR